MAMTMSGNLPSTATGGVRRRQTAAATAIGNRRRRAPTASTSFTPSAGARGASEEEGKREETDVDGELIRRSLGQSVRFARFDEELEDSDQTITGATDWWASRSANSSRRRTEAPLAIRPRSSFFPDSTDDEAMSAHKATGSRGIEKTASAAVNAVAGAIGFGGLPSFPVIHIGEIQFPVTRTVLWDRRVLAGPFALTTADVLPRLRISNGLLKKLYAQLTQETKRPTASKHAASSQPRLLGYATGGPASGGVLTLTDLDHHKPGSSPPRPSLCVYRSKPKFPEDEEQSRQDMFHAAHTAFESTTGTSGRRRGAFDIQGSAVVCIPSDRSHAEMDVELDAVVPCVELEFNLIRSLPLLMTPLAVSLLRCEFGVETQRFGFLTLDRARKAVPLLETDPLVLQRPIVGLWVYGVDVDATEAADGIRVADPFLFTSCVRFLVSKIVKERAQVAVGTFLVAVYPGSVTGPLPRFFECRATGKSSASSPVSWTVAHARSQCLAGVSSFKGDMEMALVMSESESSPSSATQMSSGNQESGARETPALEAWRSRQTNQSVTRARSSGWEGVPETTRIKDAAVASPTHAPVEKEDSASMQSCCRSQQLLALQHQEMLEKQQRQLQDMQDQIARLQHVLTETRAENARLLAAASSRSSGSSVADSERDCDRDHDRDHASIASDDVDPTEERSVSEALTDGEREEVESVQSEQAAVEVDQDTSFGKVDQDESMVSSLALSSISQGSNQSDLSSISSSVVGVRLKTLFLAEDDDDQPASSAPDGLSKQSGDTRDPQTVADATASRSSDESASGELPVRSIEQTASCPYQYIPSARYSRTNKPPQCERDEFEDESDASKIDELMAERLRIPSTPNREEIVRGGALVTFGFSHGSSFSIPKIKYVPETAICDSDEDEEEEIRRIELKYRKRPVH